VRPGYSVAIIDVSKGGVLFEVTRRLLPGAKIELHVETADGQTSCRGRVLRCAVIRLRASSVWYRAAVAFDRECACLMPKESEPDERTSSAPRPRTVEERIMDSIFQVV
jgi:hypothetical protein